MNAYKDINSLILSSGVQLCLSFQLLCGPLRCYDVIIGKCFLMRHDFFHMTLSFLLKSSCSNGGLLFFSKKVG